MKAKPVTWGETQNSLSRTLSLSELGEGRQDGENREQINLEIESGDGTGQINCSREHGKIEDSTAQPKKENPTPREHRGLVEKVVKGLTGESG